LLVVLDGMMQIKKEKEKEKRKHRETKISNRIE
jgi:hypothetical protein